MTTMGQRILVADDDPSALEGLSRLLSAWGYEVDTAQDGRVALEKVSQVRPEVVITDLVMPAMNGLELISAIRQGDQPVPVIMLTAHGNPDNLLSARREGAYACLGKPVNVAQLRSVIRRALTQGTEPAP